MDYTTQAALAKIHIWLRGTGVDMLIVIGIITAIMLIVWLIRHWKK